MEIEDKVEEISIAVDKSLGITHYGTTWAVSSYGEDTAFSPRHHVHAKTFKEVIDKAYSILFLEDQPDKTQDKEKQNDKNDN